MFKHLNTRIPKRIEQEKDKVSAVMIPLIKKNDGYHISEYGEAPDKAADIILKNDKRRANYYNYHVGEKWTNLNNYDMVIRSDFVGIDQTVECICKYLGEK